MFGYEDDLKWEMSNMRIVVEACIAFVDAFQKQGPHVTYPTKEHVAMVDAVKFYRNNKDPKLDYIKHDEKFWEGKK